MDEASTSQYTLRTPSDRRTLFFPGQSRYLRLHKPSTRTVFRPLDPSWTLPSEVELLIQPVTRGQDLTRRTHRWRDRASMLPNTFASACVRPPVSECAFTPETSPRGLIEYRNSSRPDIMTENRAFKVGFAHFSFLNRSQHPLTRSQNHFTP